LRNRRCPKIGALRNHSKTRLQRTNAGLSSSKTLSKVLSFGPIATDNSGSTQASAPCVPSRNLSMDRTDRDENTNYLARTSCSAKRNGIFPSKKSTTAFRKDEPCRCGAQDLSASTWQTYQGITSRKLNQSMRREAAGSFDSLPGYGPAPLPSRRVAIR
jgi:hypothetical protein